jgi:hypothetical protein
MPCTNGTCTLELDVAQTLSPAFTCVQAYTATVRFVMATCQLTVYSSSSDILILISDGLCMNLTNGAGIPSPSFSPSTVVIASMQDGVYALVIIRLTAAISAVSFILSNVVSPLTPAFASEIYTYNISTSYAATSLAVLLVNSSASLTLVQNGVASPLLSMSPLTLLAGNNTLVLDSVDGIYLFTVFVTQPTMCNMTWLGVLCSDASLSSDIVSGFDAAVHAYTTAVQSSLLIVC